MGDVREFHGHSLTLPWWMADYYDDEETFRNAYWNVEEGQVALDVGAAEGSYTLPALACGGTCYAFDAHFSGLTVLYELATENDFEDRCTTVDVALGDGRKLSPDLLKNMSASAYSAMVAPVNVRWSTLDAEVERLKLKRVDWIKIDVEGNELAVLRGARQTLKQYAPRLLIEDHTDVYEWCRTSDSRGKMLRLLKRDGYECEIVAHVDHGPARDYIVGHWNG